MADATLPIPPSKIEENHPWRDWFNRLNQSIKDYISVAPIPANNLVVAYGQFIDTTTQTLAANTPTVFTYNTTGVSSNVSVVSNSRITLAVAGLYQISMALQVQNSSAGLEDLDVWLRKNGSDISNSVMSYSVSNKHGGVNGKMVVSWDYLIRVAASDYLEVVWASTAATLSVVAGAAIAVPYTRPAVESVLISVLQITS